MNARNLLVEHKLRLVAHAIVKKYHNLDGEKEDMISIGVIGLIKAINTYDISKGHRLVTYAARCIENELLMMLRQEKKTSKNTSLWPIRIDKEGNRIHLLDILGTQETDLIKKIEQKENIKRIYEELEKMEMNKEKKTLIMRYGLYGREPMTQIKDKKK